MGPVERALWTAYAAWKARDESRLSFRPLTAVINQQNRRVRATVRHAYRSVPFYRETMRSAGIVPQDIQIAEDLRHLPMISGRDLRRSPESLRSSLFSPADVLELRSTGTTGSPKRILYDRRALFLTLSGGMRQRHMLHSLVGRSGGYREMAIARQDSVSIRMGDFFRASSCRLPWIDLEREILDQEVPFPTAVERIASFRPHTLFGMGSHIGALYRWAHDREIDIHRPEAIIFGGDHMADADRELLESELGIAVVSIYQAVESLRIGFECEQRSGFHLSLDTVAVRVVDEQLTDVAPGEAGDIVVSNLVNRATVLLNYRLGDRVRLLPERCPCGRTLPRLELLQGRPSEAILRPDGTTLHAGSILFALQKIAGVRQLQLEQETLRAFTLRAVLRHGADGEHTGRELAAAARSVLGAEVSVEVLVVERIRSGPGGKTRAVISRCLEPDSRNRGGT